MSVYSQAPFTLDASVPIPDEAPESITYQETDADDLKLYADEFYGVQAGPLTLTVNATPPDLHVDVDVGGVPDDVAAAVDWGDGTADRLTGAGGVGVSGHHDYRAYGVYNLAASARIEGNEYAIGEELTLTDVEPQPVVP